MGSITGTTSSGGMAGAIFTKTQQRILSLLFGQPERSFYARELMRLAGTGTGAAQRELAKLEDSGLVTVTRVGHQKHFQANQSSPIFEELRGIVLKTVGLAEPLRIALRPLAKGIKAAFVYGSIAKGTDRSQSDIDLLIVSDALTYGEVFPRVEPAGVELGRKVNPTVYSASEFSKRVHGRNSFVSRILEGPKIWIIGSENDLPA